MKSALYTVVLALLTCVKAEAGNVTVIPIFTTANNTALSLLQCAESWFSYSSASVADVTDIPVTTTTYTTSTVDFTYGTADVYTSREDIPVASGNFTPTKVVQTIVNITTEYFNFEETTLNPAILTATPSCTPPSPSQCSMLYVSYLSSLGLPPNATVPTVTPVPTNSPACPEYYYQPFSSCTTFKDSGGGVGSCFIYGETAKLFYFPTQTADAPITQTVVQSIAPGVTFTSPSVYLSFEVLSAMSWIAGSEWACTSCGWNGCQANAVGGGDALEPIGPVNTGALLALAPTDVSTLLVSEPTNAVDILAHGLPGFASVVSDVLYAGPFTPRALDVDAVAHPAPTDYYLRPHGAPGCTNDYPEPECSTIFEGLYSPVLSVPSQLTRLESAWHTCIPAANGISAVPIALTHTTTIEGSTQYPSSASSEPSQITDTCKELPTAT